MSGFPGELRVFAFAAALSAAVPAGAAAPFSVLYAFNGVDAAQPQSPLLVDSDGALVGTSPFGGDPGKGSVFRLPAGGVAGSMQILYAFTGGADGSEPFTGLVADPAGNFYGVTSGGGDSGDGTLFEIMRDGSSFAFEPLYSFSGTDGSVPVGGLAIDAAGNLYGTTARGGAGGVGTVFEWNAADAALTTLYSFSAPSSGFNADGALPEATLLRDSRGDLFGTTAAGGPAGAGVVFALVPGGSGFSFSLLHAFSGGEDQTTPVAGLVEDRSGNLFGTASGDIGVNLYGTVFELRKSGGSYVYRTIYTFQNVDDGATPYSPLVIDEAGDLFGTAAAGGPGNAGSLFELVPAGSDYAIRILHAFLGSLDGAIPAGGVVADAAGRLYGTTVAAGSFGWGTLFAFTPPPVAGSQVVRAAPGESVTISLSASDPNLGGAAFTYAIVSPPVHGTLSPVVNGTTTYTPADSGPRLDAFTFTATDANGTSNPATITISLQSAIRRVVPAPAPALPPVVDRRL